MEYSAKGLALTQTSEDCKLVAYKDGGGVWTIGFGHTKGVKQGDKITKQQAITYLQEDVKDAVQAVSRLVRVPLNQNQFDALVDFVFNLGEGAFARSTLLTLLNSRNYAGASMEFAKWNHDNGRVVDGLTKRRKAEHDLFVS